MADFGAIRPGINVRARRDAWSHHVSLLFIDALFSDGRLIRCATAKPMLFQERRAEDEGNVLEPSISLTFDEAQRLMDELWECGLRPTEGSGSAGQLASVQRHLEDMRRIAFGSIELRPLHGDAPRG